MFLFLLLVCESCNTPSDAPEKASTQPFRWTRASPAEQGFSAERINRLADELLSKDTKKLLIIRNDRIICERFAEGWDDSLKLHYSASLAKALVGGMSLALAVNDSLIHPDAPAFHFIPAWSDSYAKSKITIRQLATHTSGVEDAEGTPIEKERLIKRKMHTHMDLPGWKGQFWRKEPDPFSVAKDSANVLFTPGTHYQYSNPGIAMLGYAVTKSLKNTSYPDLRTYLKERVLDPIGVTEKEYSIGYDTTYVVDGLRLVPSWGGGAFTANAVARIGKLMLQNGIWQGERLLDSSIVAQAVRYQSTAIPSRILPGEGGNNPRHNPVPASTLGWYSNYDGVWPFLPRDAFCGAGAGNQILLVIPSLNMIIVRMGGNLYDETKGETFWGGLEKQLFNPLAEAMTASPYPESEVISDVEFAPASEVIRMAEGGDNWPMTWGANDTLYTAYGDGNGFDPKTKEKLSLGLAKVSGTPPDIKGENIRTQSGERVGEGEFGPKASGMLMVDGVLYMLTRNTRNSQLARSSDHGKTWVWAGWTFKESFGCPNFINFGKNYSGAKDEYVYIYSPDEATAYKNADHMVMARVSKNKIMDRDQYEFFAGFDSGGRPSWSGRIEKRRPIFTNPGKCYRSSISYNEPLKKYLWCQIIPLANKEVSHGPRFSGGFGIFESSNPWGPWKTVYYTRQWDMGPGESGSLPPAWMSDDGKTLHYVFSGDDSFSVRKLTLRTND